MKTLLYVYERLLAMYSALSMLLPCGNKKIVIRHNIHGNELEYSNRLNDSAKEVMHEY